jgi:hypothetical protein
MTHVVIAEKPCANKDHGLLSDQGGKPGKPFGAAKGGGDE